MHIDDVFGSVILALLVAGLAYVVPEHQVPHAMWLFVFLMMLACAFFCWKHEAAPVSPTQWLAYALAALGCSTLLYACAGGFTINAASMEDQPQLIVYATIAFLGALVALSGAARSLAGRAMSKNAKPAKHKAGPQR